MQDLDVGVRRRPRILSAISGEGATTIADEGGGKVHPFVDDTGVVPAGPLLEVAAALAEGASLLHARLRSLEPEDRDAVLETMAGQLNSIVSLWTDLVRGVVVVPPAPDAGPSTRSHPSGRVPSRPDGEADEARAQTRATSPAPAAPPATGGTGPRPTAEPGPGVRRLPRRQTETLRREEDRPEVRATEVRATEARATEARDEVPDRELWTAPLRSVKVDEPDSEYEGDRLTRDELTGVLNRQAGFAALGRELDRCRRAGERFILGYVDVDGLKEINGAQGPRAGDELLRQVTAALRATLRSYDVIMRLGGDEFLFSLPGADMATAELRASEFAVILNEEAPGSSASVGFGELRGNDTLDEIISRAEVELVKNRRSRAAIDEVEVGGRGPPVTDVTVSVDRDVAVIVLQRPPHNLLTEAVLHEVADIVYDVAGRARAAVIGSDGRSFCAGADFRSGDAPDPTDEEAFETQTGAFYAQAARLYESPVPLVAAVQGAAIGAGFGLALACDIRVVGAGGWFQANFVRLGIHPGFALSAVLPLVIGPARAADVFLTGRRLAADEALAIGLAQKLVDGGNEMNAAIEIATQIASGAPLAVASTRATLRRGLGATARAAMRHELAEQTALAGTADAVEGVNAMLEGRTPRFAGR